MAGNRRGEADISVVVTDNSNALGHGAAIGRDSLDDTTADVDLDVTGVDAPAATAMERAQAALLVACEGWRKRRRCTAPDGSRIPHPHPGCLAAQYRHELILLENGIPR